MMVARSTISLASVVHARHPEVILMIALGMAMLVLSLAMLALARNVFGAADAARRLRLWDVVRAEAQGSGRQKFYRVYARVCLISALGAFGYAGADFLRLR